MFRRVAFQPPDYGRGENRNRRGGKYVKSLTSLKIADEEIKLGGLGDGSPPAGSRGGAPVGVWWRSPQMLATFFEYNNQKHRLMSLETIVIT